MESALTTGGFGVAPWYFQESLDDWLAKTQYQIEDIQREYDYAGPFPVNRSLYWSL